MSEHDPKPGVPRGYSWPPFEAGNTAALTHGAHSPRLVEPLALEILEATVAAAEAPGSSTDFLSDPSYRPALVSWARTEARVQLLAEWLMAKADTSNAGGLLDSDGEVRSATELLIKLERAASNHRSRLGLDPLSRARLRRDTAAASVDVAALLAQLAAAERQAGANDDEEADDADDQ